MFWDRMCGSRACLATLLYLHLHGLVGALGARSGEHVRLGAGSTAILLALEDVPFPAQHLVGDVDLGAREPLVGVDDPPDQGQEHGATPDQTGPVHARGVEVGTRQAGQTQDRDHEGGEAG